jgi:hypothetical protein
MCGFCSEGTAIELASALASGKVWTPELENMMTFEIAYLQESENVFPAFERAEEQFKNAMAELNAKGIQSLAQLKAADGMVPLDSWFELVGLRVAFCRIVELLVKKGFDSDEYQNLITIPFVAEVITTLCQFTPPPPFNERLFAPDSSLREVFQRDFFRDKAFRNKTLNSSDFRADCVKLLTTYVEQWHSKREDWEDDFESVQVAFPYIFLSFIVVETHYPDSGVFAQMVKNTPGHFGASFETLEMWLQRKAALRLYETMGLSAFLSESFNEEKSRPALIYYLLVKQKLNSVAKQTLLNLILQSGKYDPDEDWSFAKKRRLIYMAPQSFIMEILMKNETT